MCTEALTLWEELQRWHRSIEVSVRITCGGEEKITYYSLESGAYVAKRRKRREEKERSDRGGGCLHLITGLCPSYERVYSTAARPVLCSVQCNALAML